MFSIITLAAVSDNTFRRSLFQYIFDLNCSGIVNTRCLWGVSNISCVIFLTQLSTYILPQEVQNLLLHVKKTILSASQHHDHDLGSNLVKGIWQSPSLWFHTLASYWRLQLLMVAYPQESCLYADSEILPSDPEKFSWWFCLVHTHNVLTCTHDSTKLKSQQWFM